MKAWELYEGLSDESKKRFLMSLDDDVACEAEYLDLEWDDGLDG